MTDKAKIEVLVRTYIKGSDIFLVAVRVSSTGRITVLADTREGITIDQCAQLSRFIENNLDREKEDFELQVSSPGLDMPFLVKEQYYKNEGKRIEVTDNEGTKHSGILKNVTDGGFELETGNIKKAGKKERAAEQKEISFNYDQVKSAREIVTFKY